jgi:hypothetical protein
VFYFTKFVFKAKLFVLAVGSKELIYELKVFNWRLFNSNYTYWTKLVISSQIDIIYMLRILPTYINNILSKQMHLSSWLLVAMVDNNKIKNLSNSLRHTKINTLGITTNSAHNWEYTIGTPNLTNTKGEVHFNTMYILK